MKADSFLILCNTVSSKSYSAFGPTLGISGFPSLNNKTGDIILSTKKDDVIHAVHYDKSWFGNKLKALERIRTDLPTFLTSNWASATAGYGTPGYKNSESASDNPGADLISIEPKIFSPYKDGYTNYCFINYHLPASGFMGSISIYDISGRMVRFLVNNIIWATSGSFRWEGLNTQQNPLPTDHHIIYLELFRTDGIVIRRKLVCTLAKRN